MNHKLEREGFLSKRLEPLRSKPYKVSIAPMMDWTDRHYRYFIRQITKSTLLYTEMLTSNAVIHGDRDYLLGFSEIEHPLSFQLGGSELKSLREAAKIVEGWGYDEINLNVGCPSDRVSNGNFGACLMADPNLVCECIDAMRKAVSIPVTVKHRIGIDSMNSYEDLHRFVEIVSASEADRFVVHARVAILGGLSPKQNREIPPLRYEDVYRLKKDFPDQIVEINGGIKTIDSIREQLQQTDGVMIGRTAYDDPYLFAEIERDIFGNDEPALTRAEVAEQMLPYIENFVEGGQRVNRVTRHMMGLMKGQAGAKFWRRALGSTHRTLDGFREILKVLQEHEAKKRDRSSSSNV